MTEVLALSDKDLKNHHINHLTIENSIKIFQKKESFEIF
jgi:hypothetical protein